MSALKLDLDRLKKCRENLGISKNEAAHRIDISQPAYLRYESGERTPSLQILQIPYSCSFTRTKIEHERYV